MRLEQALVPLSVSHVEGCPDLGPECSRRPAPTPYEHHVSELVAETALDASLGITPWLGVDARWSLRVVDVDPTYTELDGRPRSVPNEIHHHDETLVDLTDPWLLARVGASSGPLVSVARFGLSFPVGRTEQDPYALGREGKSHEHVQAGTGTFVPIVGLGLSYALAPVTLGLGATGFFNASESSKGYRAPTRLSASHRVSVDLLGGTLTPFATAMVAHEGEEYWHGRPGGEGSNVRTELYVGAGLGFRFRDGWSLEGSASRRVASLTDAPTFASAGIFSLSLSTSFALWGGGSKGGEPGGAPAEEATPRVIERRHDGVLELEKE